MARTLEERREYSRGHQRGYATAKNGNWPDGCPNPPDELVAAVFQAAREFGNAVDAEMAMFEEGDEMAERLYEARDRMIAAMEAVANFAREQVRQD